jgi:DNA-binding response OmpR family regulator
MRVKILLVDDESDLLVLVSHYLEVAGYEVSTANNGNDALNKARREQPDLILLDLVMPDLDGLTVCEILRCQASTSRIPVIMLTAMTSELTRLNGLASGAADYLPKPFQREVLLERLNKVLSHENSKAQEETTWFGSPLSKLKLDN